jgi:hypothetical protein
MVMSAARESRASTASQQEMDDLVRRRATGPLVFRGPPTEEIGPVLETTMLDTGGSAVMSLRMAEQRKAQQMKEFVREQCKKKGMSQLISPYIGERTLLFFLPHVCTYINFLYSFRSSLGSEEDSQSAPCF